MSTVDVTLAETDIEEMIKEADVNGDGKIDFDEFIKMMQSQWIVIYVNGIQVWRHIQWSVTS